jgi:hypothetical protein
MRLLRSRRMRRACPRLAAWAAAEPESPQAAAERARERWMRRETSNFVREAAYRARARGRFCA